MGCQGYVLLHKCGTIWRRERKPIQLRGTALRAVQRLVGVSTSHYLLLTLSAFMLCSWGGDLWGQQAQRDQQGLAILNQTIAAGGGSALLSSIEDFTGNGTVTYNWNPQGSGDVKVKGRGQHQFRTDATLPDGVRTLIANNGSGSITETDGTVRTITHDGAVGLGSLTFPYTFLLMAIQDSSISITYVGMANHLGTHLHDVKIQNTYPKTVDPDGRKSRNTVRDFYIDPSTFLVVSVFSLINPTADGGGIPHEVVFADYHAVNGVVAPLGITESVRGQSLLTLTLSQLSFNTGLTDVDFAR